MLRGLRNQKPPMLPRVPPSVVGMPGELPSMSAPPIGFQQVPNMANLQGIAPAVPPMVMGQPPVASPPIAPQPVPDIASMLRGGILSRVGEAIADPATSRALMAFGMNLLGSGDFGRAFNAGILANDTYNEGKRRDFLAEVTAREEERKGRRDDAMLGLEERKVGVLERREISQAALADAEIRFKEAQAKVIQEQATTGRISALSLAEYRRASVELERAKLANAREIALIREAGAKERTEMTQAGANERAAMTHAAGPRGRSITPKDAAGVLSQALTEAELKRLQSSPEGYPAALDAVAAAYEAGEGITGARAAAVPMVPPSFFGRLFGGGQAPAPAPAAQGPVRIQNDEEFNALPSGTQFIGPDGRLRIKP